MPLARAGLGASNGASLSEIGRLTPVPRGRRVE
jgi:hypothetical protein